MSSSEIEILLVEDNVDDAEMTIRALRKANIGNPITHLKDGAEALAYIFGDDGCTLTNKGVQPRLILLDLKMPKVNGKEVIMQLKSDAITKNIPIVVLTSSKEDPDIKVCYEMGVNSYIVKPVGFENFTKAVVDLGTYWILLNQYP